MMHVMRDRAKPLPGTDGYGCHFIGALLAAAGPLIGGLLGKKGADDAAQVNAQARDQALQFQREQIEQARTDLAPFREVGQANIRTLGAEIDPLTREFGLEDFKADPGFQFRRAEGEKGINRAAAARGQFLNPSTVKALSRFGGELASDEFGRAFNRFQVGQGNRFNRLSALAGAGQNAINTGVNAGANFANQSAAAAQTGGSRIADNRLSGTGGLVSGVSGAIASGVDQFNVNRFLKSFEPNQPVGSARF